MIANPETNALEKAEATVSELYEFRDTYVDVYGIDKCGERNAQVEARLKSSLAQLDHLQLSIDNKAVFFYLRGKALNITPSFDVHAEECLSKAVKLDPNLIEAWNQLGESYWKNHNVAAASNCFTGAIAKKKNKASLRNLSMVQRQLGSNYDEKVANIKLSVDTAKQAVAMDVNDGHSWFVLGNAFLSVFFFAGQNPAVLKQCMSAYTRAEKDSTSANNPDLHYNRAVAYRYQEDFGRAIASYHRASLLDPTWNEPRAGYDDLVKRLKLSYEMVKNKGKLKAKKLNSLLGQIKESDLGPFIGGSYTSPLNKTISLKCCVVKDLHTERNDNTVIHGKVIAIIPVDDGVPFSFVLMDSAGDCIVASVFNLAVGKGMIIGDSIAIPEPFVQINEVTLTDEQITFKSIRVDNPVVLVLNKRKIGPERMAFSILNVTNKSEWHLSLLVTPVTFIFRGRKKDFTMNGCFVVHKNIYWQVGKLLLFRGGRGL